MFSLLLCAVAIAGETTHGQHGMAPAKEHYLDKEIESYLNHCANLPVSYSKNICLGRYFRAMTQQYSAKRAIASAQELVKQGVIEDCHVAAHMIGAANIVKHDFDLETALSSCSMACDEGCVHGVMRTYIPHEIQPSHLAGTIKHICDTTRADAWLHRQCIHGIGHGIMNNGFLPAREAIKLCNLFEGEDVDSCLGGLFMENMHPALVWPEDRLRKQLFSVCADIVAMRNDTYTQYCIESIGEGLMFYTGHDLGKSLGYCELLPGEHWTVCKQAAIDEAGNALSRFDVKTCDLAPDDRKDFCRSLAPIQQTENPDQPPD